MLSFITLAKVSLSHRNRAEVLTYLLLKLEAEAALCRSRNGLSSVGDTTSRIKRHISNTYFSLVGIAH